MREEKLFRAIGEIDGDLIEQARTDLAVDFVEAAGRGIIFKAGKQRRWLKYTVIAAGLLLVIGLMARIHKNPDVELAQNNSEQQDDSGQQNNLGMQDDSLKSTEDKETTEGLVVQDTEKPLMDFTIAFAGMGYEGIMGYEMPKRGNPWKENDEITTLPIFENTTVYKRTQVAADEWLKEERYEQMEAWLLEVMSFLGMKSCEINRNLTECVADNGKIKITVDGNMHLRIEFEEALALPAQYNTSKEASVEETREVAEYVMAEYGEVFSMENPQISIVESDYSFYGTRYHHTAHFYEKGENVKDTLLNYCFSYVEYFLNEEGKLWMIDIVRRDWNVIGEYEVISLEEAVTKLLQGEYDTSYFGDSIPTAEYIREVELTYFMSAWEDFKPYYKFWVEVPAEKRENGLNTYVAYYVPAIEGAYVEITFN